jgi:hypothetical protein
MTKCFNSLFFLYCVSALSTISSFALTIGNFTNCTVTIPQFIGDDICDGGDYNTVECGFDGGDCNDFNMNFPACAAEFPFLLANGKCEGGAYNTPECDYDGGDCDRYNMYPKCNVTNPKWLGDDQCDFYVDQAYHTKECGYDFGDCISVLFPNCTVEDPLLLGNGECNGGDYNVEACEYDGGDCKEFNNEYPNCAVDNPIYIGNGLCDGGQYNSTECGLDGGDCIILFTKETDNDDATSVDTSTNGSSSAAYANFVSFNSLCSGLTLTVAMVFIA